MLSPASWVHKAQFLQVGGRFRTDHDCGGGRTLTLRRDEKGLHAYCFRCSDNGWVPPVPEALAVRLERLGRQASEDSKVQGACEPPSPSVTAWADWPAECRLWLLKAGLSSADLPGLGAYYHPPSDRVVLRVFRPSGEVAFWQARAVDKRQPKYLGPDIPKGSIIPAYGKANRVTLTEDILSAYKVGLAGGEGWSLLGTSLSKPYITALIERGCEVNVWLDPDAAGRRATAKVLPVLRSMGIVCHDIVSKVDPKLVHREQIKELI